MLMKIIIWKEYNKYLNIIYLFKNILNLFNIYFSLFIQLKKFDSSLNY